MSEYKPARMRRLLAWLIDWAVILVIYLLLMPLMDRLGNAATLAASVFPIGMFALFLCRDYLLSGRSVGKRLMKLTVMDRERGTAADGGLLVLRNLFLFLYPVDAAFLFFSGRSLGERATRTAVVRAAEPARPIVKKRFAIVAAVVLAISLPFGLMLHFLLNEVKTTEAYSVAHAYLTQSEAFAAQGAQPGDADLTGFASRTERTAEGSVTVNEFTFTVDGQSYTVVCHPEGDTWAVCGDCTEFD